MRKDWRLDDLNNDTTISTYQAAKILQVDPATVKNWADSGVVVSFRTPGGHRRIRAADLADMIRKNGMPMPKLLRALAPERPERGA